TSDTSLEPAGIAELGIPGLVPSAAPARIDSGCRTDLLAVDLKPFPVRVTGPAAATVRSDALLGLAVTPCDPRDPARVPTLALGPGRHIVSTARGKDLAFSIDRLVLASGTSSTPIALGGGTVTSLGATPASANTPQVTVVKQGRTSMRVHVDGATQPFWMVLGQSQSKGWKAHVVGAKDL